MLQKEIAFVSEGDRPCLRDTSFSCVLERNCICLRRRLPLSRGDMVFVAEKGCLCLRNHFAVLQEDNRLCHIGRLPVSQGQIAFLCSRRKWRFSYREAAGVSGRHCQNKIASVSDRSHCFCFGTNSLCLTRTLLLPWEDIVFVSE